MKKLKLLPPSSLEKLISAGKPIYVLNTSSLTSGNKGVIVVNFYDGTRKEYFKMPPTFIPMAVSDSIPAKKLAESRDFKQCLVKGMLSLVDPDSAEDFLSTDEAREEYEALVLSEHSVKAKGLNIEHEVAKRAQVSHQISDAAGPVESTVASEGDSVSTKIRGIVESYTSGEMQTNDVLTNLKRHQSALSQLDLTFVMTNVKDAAVVKWVKQCLASKQREEDTETQADTLISSIKKSAKVATAKKVAAPKKTEPAFDFNDKDDSMTPEERAADERARRRAMAEQATAGQSLAETEINKILGGKGY